MDNYKEASRLNLVFETSKGNLTVTQLWQLKKTDIALVVRNIKKKLVGDVDDDLAFLDDTSAQVDKVMQLKFDIAKDVYVTKKEEDVAALTAKENKEINAKIMDLIQKKKEGALEEKSIEELTAMLKQ